MDSVGTTVSTLAGVLGQCSSTALNQPVQLSSLNRLLLKDIIAWWQKVRLLAEVIIGVFTRCSHSQVSSPCCLLCKNFVPPHATLPWLCPPHAKGWMTARSPECMCVSVCVRVHLKIKCEGTNSNEALICENKWLTIQHDYLCGLSPSVLFLYLSYFSCQNHTLS